MCRKQKTKLIFFVGGLRFDYANLTITFFVYNKRRRQRRKII